MGLGLTVIAIVLIGYSIVIKISKSVYRDDFSVKGSEGYNENLKKIAPEQKASTKKNKDAMKS